MLKFHHSAVAAIGKNETQKTYPLENTAVKFVLHGVSWSLNIKIALF